MISSSLWKGRRDHALEAPALIGVDALAVRGLAVEDGVVLRSVFLGIDAGEVGIVYYCSASCAAFSSSSNRGSAPTPLNLLCQASLSMLPLRNTRGGAWMYDFGS